MVNNSFAIKSAGAGGGVYGVLMINAFKSKRETKQNKDIFL